MHRSPLSLAAVLLIGLPALAQALQWSDEFNGPAGSLPDASNWTYDTGHSGFGNPEIEHYCAAGSNQPPCSSADPNASLDGEGHLVIKARRNKEGQWISARLKSQGLRQFQYGRIEARMKLPVGDGFWPAFWMLGANIDTVGWPRCGEQDIMEWVQSYTPYQTSSTTHGPGYSGAKGPGARAPFAESGRIDDGFHTYGMVWAPNRIAYYRDDPATPFLILTPEKLPPGSAWVFNQPFFLLLNFAIGKGGFPGGTDATTPDMATMLVDYVRVYALPSAPTSHTPMNTP